MGESFSVYGYVREDGEKMVGVTVNIYVDGSFVTSTTTDSNGYYSRNIWISTTGSHTLKATSIGASASRSITVKALPYVNSVTISLPSSASNGSPFTVSGYVRDQYGNGVSDRTVYIYRNGTQVASAVTDSSGYYSKSQTINTDGSYVYEATCAGVWSTGKTITITSPPYISSVSISAPASANEGENFTVSGYVRDQYGSGYGGATVSLYRNDSFFASIFTNSSGYYSKSTSISTAGTYTLKAVADSKQATRSITIYAILIGTTLSINAPAQVTEGEAFNVVGWLTRNDTGGGLPGQTISLYENGVYKKATTTASDGSYIIQHIIAAPGTYTLRTQYAGTSLMAPAYNEVVINGEIPTMVKVAALAAAAWWLTRKN